jgi:hypothetical protein
MDKVVVEREVLVDGRGEYRLERYLGGGFGDHCGNGRGSLVLQRNAEAFDSTGVAEGQCRSFRTGGSAPGGSGSGE